MGYWGENVKHNSDAFVIPIANVIGSGEHNEASEQDQTIPSPAQWTRMTAAAHLWTTLVPCSSPPMIIGGRNIDGTATANISVYNDSTGSWKNIASFSSGRSQVAIAAINDNAIIAIGGYTLGGTTAHAMSSCETTVELGQAKIIKPMYYYSTLKYAIFEKRRTTLNIIAHIQCSHYLAFVLTNF